jgi:hypothetical protein
VRIDFTDAVNVTAAEFDQWLNTNESIRAGDTKKAAGPPVMRQAVGSVGRAGSVAG